MFELSQSAELCLGHHLDYLIELSKKHNLDYDVDSSGSPWRETTVFYCGDIYAMTNFEGYIYSISKGNDNPFIDKPDNIQLFFEDKNAFHNAKGNKVLEFLKLKAQDYTEKRCKDDDAPEYFLHGFFIADEIHIATNTYLDGRLFGYSAYFEAYHLYDAANKKAFPNGLKKQ